MTTDTADLSAAAATLRERIARAICRERGAPACDCRKKGTPCQAPLENLLYENNPILYQTDAVIAAYQTWHKEQRPWGCHCDLEPGQTPDGCVIDEDRRHDCHMAEKVAAKEECTYWRQYDAKTPPNQ